MQLHIRDKDCPLLVRSQQTLTPKPVFTALWPCQRTGHRSGQPLPVTPLTKNVQFGRHLGPAECQVKIDAVFWGYATIIIRVEQKRRRRLGGDLLFVGQAPHQFRCGVFTDQIDNNVVRAGQPSAQK